MFPSSPSLWRIFITYICLVILSVALFEIFIIRSISTRVETEVEADLIKQTELLANVVSGNGVNLNQEELADLVNNFSSVSNFRFTIFTPERNILASSHTPSLEAERQQAEVLEIENESRRPLIRFSQNLGSELRYYSVPVYQSGQDLIATVQGASLSSQIENNINQQQGLMRSYGMISLFISVVAAFFLALMQAIKVNRLIAVSEKISEGNFERRVPEINTFGLRKLAAIINKLARNSAERFSVISAERNRLATIFTGMVEGVIDVDQNQRVIQINEAARRMLNVSENNVNGLAVWDVIRHHEITEALGQAIKSQSVIKAQMHLSRRSTINAEVSIVEIYAASLSDDSGEPIGAVAVLHNITELKNLERIRTDFVANASHELKTPITAIRGLSESVMDDDEVDTKTLSGFMKRIHKQSIRLSQLIGDLMTLSRLESNQEVEDFAIINISDLVKRSILTVEAMAASKRQKIKTDIHSPNIEVYGDRQNLSQLIDNLIDNAVKYTSEEGEIHIKLDSKNGEMILQVADNGIGISPQYLQRIFERFYRIDKARSLSLGGTGLGLSIVKNIAEKHGGNISVESQLGLGSIFTFSMPLVNP